jgi:hypothetical protein
MALETTEEKRTCKDFQHGRKDAEREFYHYEGTRLLPDAAKRTSDIVCF